MPGTPHAPVEAPTRPDNSPAGIAAVLGAVFVWGVGNVLVKDVALDGLALAFWRLWLGAAIYFVVLRLRGGRLTTRSLRLSWKGGLAFAGDIAAFYAAVKLTTLANATIIGALQPAALLFFAAIVFGERILPRHVFWTVVAIAGVVLVMLGSSTTGQSDWRGDLLAFVALATWVWYFIASKKARQELGTLEYMTGVAVVGAVAITPLAVASGQSLGLSWSSLVAVLLIIAIPGSGHLLLNWAHNHTTLTVSSLLTLALPAVSTAAGVLFLDERATAVTWIGMAVVLVALAAVVVRERT